MSAALARAALRTASVPYGWAVSVRNRRFDRGDRVVTAPVPVVSVGNLTVGGTGKTPMVEWLARHARQQGLRVAVLSRGYGAAADGRNDEALELELALPDVPHLQDPDRTATAAIAAEELGSQLLVLDDGFQHRRLARDFDLVLLDATEPFGFDRLLPRGTLREPVAGLRRAHAIALTRADMLDGGARDTIRRRVERINPHAAWCEVAHRPARLLASDGAGEPLVKLAGKPIAAFCGIGNPAGFRHTLETLGGQIVAWREFPDHHGYTRADVDDLAAWAGAAGAAMLVCTRKDLVKLRTSSLGGAPLRALGIELGFLAGQAALEAAVAPVLQRAAEIPELASGE